MRPRLLLGIVGIIIFTSLLMLNFGNSISSYIGFDQAQNEGSIAHVVGAWDKEMPSGFSMQTKSFSFYMTDEYGATKKVIYSKAKPSNFDEADKIVVIGEMKGEIFYANDMLLKCPSKYNDANAAQFEPAEAGV
jgi:cytochrome c-type biogenesis protein CcmE